MNFLDFLFPKTCMSCGSWGQYICELCQLSFVPIQKDSCLYCDRITPSGQIHEQCRRHYEIDCYNGLWYLNNPLQRVIRQIKYKLVTDAFRALCMTVDSQRLELIRSYPCRYPSCVIQPVPLHPRRFAQRGFNQADLIAQFLHEGTGFPIVNTLQRIRHTLPQAQTQSRIERYRNMQQAFVVRNVRAIAGKTVILVDDIYTTGNTVKSAAATCKRAGADAVHVFTLAKG